MKEFSYLILITSILWIKNASAQSGVCFNAKVAYSAFTGGIYPNSVGPAEDTPSTVSGDFNEDGIADLAVSKVEYSNWTANAFLSVLLSNSSESFVDTVNFPLGGFDAVSAVIATDFNADDNVDLVVVTDSWGFLSPDVSSLFILFGNGQGGFTDAVSFYWGYDLFRSLIPGDFNEDGKADLATVNFYGRISILFGNGDGSFWLPRSSDSSASADFNGDGNIDLATAYYAGPNDLFIFFGNGEGGFNSELKLAVGMEPAFVISANLNGDGFIDLVTANKGSNDVSVLLNNGLGTFYIPLYMNNKTYIKNSLHL